MKQEKVQKINRPHIAELEKHLSEKIANSQV